MRCHRVRSLAILVIAALTAAAGSIPAAASARAATTISVPGDYPTIQAAVDAAVAGDSILVAPGTYAGHVSISKAITLQASGDVAATILDGGGTGRVLSITGAVTVRGFTIRNGLDAGIRVSGTGAVLDANEVVDNHGCGIEVASGGASITDSHIARNAGHCGGIHLHGAGSSVVSGNLVEDNSAAGYNGGGIHVETAGGAIDGNVVRRNEAYAGGGISLHGAPVAVTNNLVVDNHASWGGGGIDAFMPAGTGSFSIANNTLIDNTATVYGSGIDLYVIELAGAMRNNVVVGENPATALIQCGGSNGLTVEGNDAWSASGPGFAGTCAGGSNGNISIDPKLVDRAHGDGHLRPDSPLIDAGIPDPSVTKDADGDARPFDGDENGSAVIDPGFDESTDPLLVSDAFLDYAETSLGSSLERSETLQNLGSGALEVTAAAVDGPQASDFTKTADTCSGATLAVGATCTVTVTFAPLADGDRAATLTISGPGAVGTRPVALSGLGDDPLISLLRRLAFDPVRLNEAATRDVVLANAGPPASVSSVAISGTNAADFMVKAETCTAAPIPTAGTCTITVSFTPSALDDREASLSVVGPSLVGTRSVALTGIGTRALSPVAWGSTYAAGPAYARSLGRSFARSVQAGAQRLHLVYWTNRIGSTWVKDTGPYLGVYYIRSGAGSRWTTPKRLNPTTQHGSTPALAAASSRVYAVWVSRTTAIAWRPKAPRAVWFRANTSYGSPTAWSPAKRLTSASGRVDYPTVAATGTDVHVAYTDSVTGKVKVASSTNRGSTFVTHSVGTTTKSYMEGFSATPSVAAAGSTVAVAWVSDDAAAISVRVSTDRGAHWEPTRVLTPHGAMNTPFVSVAVRGTRIAVTWSDGRGVILAMRTAGVWAPDRMVAPPAALPLGDATVTLHDPDRVGVAWSAVTDDEDQASELRWAESPDGGVHWYEAQVVGPRVRGRNGNESPSLIWRDAATRIVAWNARTGASSRQVIRIGTGTPPAMTLRLAPLAGEP